MTFALTDFRYLDQAEMKVIPPGHPEPIATIVFAGPGHRQTVERNRRATERAIVGYRSAAAIERDNVQVVADRILGWSGIAERESPEAEPVDVPFSEAAAMKLLLDPRLGWLYGQCVAFLNSAGTFVPKTTSDAD
jgi:hypothetical protein